MDAQTVAISKLQRKLALQQHQLAMKAVCEVAAWEIQRAWKRMLDRMLVRKVRANERSESQHNAI